MVFSLRTTDPRLPQEDTGPGGDRGCRFCNIMMAHPRRVTDGCFQKSRQAARRHPPGMKMAVLKFVPLDKGMEALRKLPPAHFAAGGVGGTHPGAKAPGLPGGDFRRSCSCRLVAPRSMKMAPPLGQGGLQGGFERGNETHRGAVAVVRSVADEHTNHPRRGRWPGIPSSTEEGNLFSRESVSFLLLMMKSRPRGRWRN